MGTLIKGIGEIQEVSPENGKDYKLGELYKMLDCELIEVIRLEDNKIMIIDEEGKLTGKNINVIGSMVYQDQTGINDFIVGDCLIIDNNELK